jgi:lipoprotein-releasing system ATP-binding protein
MNREQPAVLAAARLTRSFPSGERVLEVLRGVDLEVRGGETVAIVGPSGSGKSTLLHCLGGLDVPTAGTVHVRGRCLAGLSDRELARVRNLEIGFVFQFHHLLPDFTALENVMLPALIARTSGADAAARARELLAAVGLTEREEHTPSELSGGEQQRVAVARALANRPGVVLADEPSGNLDARTSAELHGLLRRLRDEFEVTFVIATHDSELGEQADRVLTLAEGVLRAGGGDGRTMREGGSG